MSDDEKAIRVLIERWMSATETGDVSSILDLMTDDVIFLVPGKEPFGKAEFAAASAAMKNVKIAATSEIQEIEIVGDWAHLRNHIEMSVTPHGGSAVRRTGYTLTVMRKGPDGKWRLSRDANLLTVKS
ncbi:MAG TPA: SgcJ/EcaC family oxidoreductase [Aestuariivirga sp.]